MSLQRTLIACTSGSSRSLALRIRQSTSHDLFFPCHRSVSFTRCFSSEASSAADTHESLLAEARLITIQLYRTCLKSVRIIRTGNAHDEAEFRRLEEKQMQRQDPTLTDPRLTMLSMVPPVNRQRELHSRAEYYWQYVQEQFVNELDIFYKPDKKNDDHSPQQQQQQQYQPLDFQEAWQRYFHFVRYGMTQRTWLLQDMKFDDPFQTLDKDLTKTVNALEKRVNAFLEQQLRDEQQRRRILMGGDPTNEEEEDEDFDDDNDDDFFNVSTSDEPDWEDDEEDDEGY